MGGAQAVAVFAFGFEDAERPTAGPGRLRAGQPGHRSGQHLGRRGQALPQGRHRHRRRGRPDRDRGARRRHRRPRARRRRPRVSQAEHDPQAAVGAGHRQRRRSADAVTGRGRAPGRRPPSTPSASSEALAGPQSGVVLVDDLDAGLAVVNAYAAEHLEIQIARRRRGQRRGSATPVPSSSGRTRRSASATTSPGPTTCCPRAAAPATAAACRCSRSCAASTSSTTTRTRCATSPTTSSRWPQAEDLPAHGEAVRPASATGRDRPMTELDDGPHRRVCSARTCAAGRLTAHRSSTSPCASTPTRTPTPCRPSVVAEIAARGRPRSRPA